MVYSKALESVLEMVENTKYMILQFADLLGGIKGRTIPASYIKSVFEKGSGFDGSSIPGFTKIENSDLLMKPDPATVNVLPEYIYGRPVAMAFCNIYTPEDKPFESDPRYICKKTVEKLKAHGYKPYIAPEIEFYLVKNENGEIKPVEDHVVETHRYFDVMLGKDLTEMYRMDLCDALVDIGMTIERGGHELGPAQNEITFKYSTPVETADNVLRYKFVAKAIAQRKYGWTATFMPKPWTGLAGNGMHVHISLYTTNGETNLFYDENGYAGTSQLCRYFIGGLLYHSRALCALVAPTVNSYKRLVPGYEAPVYLAWSKRNRSALIRVPEYRIKDNGATRIEFRVPDPVCNPYLAFAAIFEAGLDGIKKKIEPGDPIERNIYRLSETERKRLGVGVLPGSLKEALEEWATDDICVKVLGKETAEKYVELKLKEWEEYRKNVHNPNGTEVSVWELKKYLHL